MNRPADLDADTTGGAFLDRVTADLKANGMELRPDEEVLVLEACRTINSLDAMRATGADDRDVRLAQEQLRKLLRAVDWPSTSGWDNLTASQRARKAASARWS